MTIWTGTAVSVHFLLCNGAKNSFVGALPTGNEIDKKLGDDLTQGLEETR